MTNEEREQVKREIIAELKSESNDITALETATDINNVKSMPVLQGNKLVLVPVSLLLRLQDMVNEAAKDYIKRKADGIIQPGACDVQQASDYVTLQIPYIWGWNDDESTETKELDIPAATEIEAGVMSAEDKEKLKGIEKGATADSALTDDEIDEIMNI